MFARRPHHRLLGLALALLFLGSFLGEPRGLAVPGSEQPAAHHDSGAHAHHVHDHAAQHEEGTDHPVSGHGSHSEGPDPHCQILCATTAVFDPTGVLPVGALVGLLYVRTPSARIPEMHLLAAAVAHPFLLPFGQAPPTSVL